MILYTYRFFSKQQKFHKQKGPSLFLSEHSCKSSPDWISPDKNGMKCKTLLYSWKEITIHLISGDIYFSCNLWVLSHSHLEVPPNSQNIIWGCRGWCWKNRLGSCIAWNISLQYHTSVIHTQDCVDSQPRFLYRLPKTRIKTNYNK